MDARVESAIFNVRFSSSIHGALFYRAEFVVYALQKAYRNHVPVEMVVES